MKFFILFFILFKSLQSEFFINETSIYNDYYETLFNYYALDFYDKTNIKLYTCYFVSSNSSNEFNKKLETIFKEKSKNNQKVIISLFSVNDGLLKFKHNVDSLDTISLEKIGEDFFKYHLNTINYKVDNHIIKEYIPDINLKKNKPQVLEVVLTAPLTLLKGVCKNFKISHNFDEKTNSFIRDKKSFKKKLDIFNKKDIKVDSTKISNFIESKKEMVEKPVENEKEEFNFKLNGNILIKHNYSHLEDDDKDLVKNVEYEDNRWFYSASLVPKAYVKDSFESVSSFSFIYLKNYLDSSKTEKPKLKFDFIQNTFFHNKLKIIFRLGDLFLEHNKIILNRAFRGYQANFESNYEDKMTFKSNIFYTPLNKSFGIKNDQPKTSGIILSFLNKYNNNDTFFKYIFCDAENEKEEKLAQQIYFYSENKEFFFEKFLIDFTLLDNLLEDFILRLYSKIQLKFTYDVDYTNIDLSGIYTDKKFETSIISKNYSNTSVPSYVGKRSAIGQYGFKINIDNTLFKKILYNKINFSNHINKNIILRKFNILNILTLNENLNISNNYTRNRNNKRRKINYFLDMIFKVGDNPREILNIRFSNDKNIHKEKPYFLKNRIEIKNNFSLVKEYFKLSSDSSCFYDFYKLTKENIYSLGTNKKISYKDYESVFLKGNYTLLSKEKCKTKIFSLEANKSFQDDSMFYNIFDSKMLKSHLDLKYNYIFSDVPNEFNKIYSYSINSFIPFTFFSINNNLKLNIYSLKNQLANENNYNYDIKYYGRRKILYNLDLSLEYNYFNAFFKNEKLNKHFLRLESNGKSHPEFNNILSNAGRESLSNHSKMKSENYSINKVKGLTHFRFEKSILDIDLNFGFGIENKFYHLDSKKINGKFITYGLKTTITPAQDFRIVEELSIEEHFSVRKRVTLNKVGIFYLSNNIRSSNSFNIKKESLHKIEKYNELLLEFVSKLFLDVNKSHVKLDLDCSRRVKSNINEDMLVSNLKINSNITDNSFVKSDISSHFELNLKKVKEDKKLFIGIKSEGHFNLLNNFNVITSSGSYYRYISNKDLREIASISAKDTQKIMKDVYIFIEGKYTSSINKDDKDFKIYNFKIGMNISKLILENLVFSIDIEREYRQYPHQFILKNKLINKNNLNISYSF